MKKVVIFILSLSLVFVTYFVLDNQKDRKVSSPEIIEDVPEDEGPVVTKLSLGMTGDALIHGALYGNAKIGDTYDFSYLFKDVKDIISKFDLAYYNQETIIGGKSLGLSTYPRFNSPEEFGDEMLSMGFNIVSFATNHSLDKGEIGIVNSNNYWSTKNVLGNGVNVSVEQRNEIKVKEKNGISYTLLSYTTSTNGIPVPKGKDYLVNLYDKDKVKEDIEKIRDKVDVLMVAMHFGEEYTNTPNSNQRDIASYLSSLGVDIVIGCHPHVLQPVEKIDNTYVFYSLGNFVSAQRTSDQMTGVIMSLDITKTVYEGLVDIKIDNINAELIFTTTNADNGYKVIPYTMMTVKDFVNYKDVYNKYVGVLTRYYDDITITKLKDD